MHPDSEFGRYHAALLRIKDLTEPGQQVNVSTATDIICDVWNTARYALSDDKRQAPSTTLSES